MNQERALDAEIKAFEGQKRKLEKNHRGKYVVFRERKLVGAWDTFHAAATDAVQRFGRGPYLIRQVGAAPPRPPVSVIVRPARRD